MFTAIWAYLTSLYLYYLWGLLLLLLPCWGLAFIAYMVLPGDRTIVWRARTAWGIALFVHAVTCISMSVYWVVINGNFDGFAKFFALYAILSCVATILALAAWFTAGRYRSFDRAFFRQAQPHQGE